MRWSALPPRYPRSVVGLKGSSSAPGSQGFCHGATPFSSIWMIESVTSCRKSRRVGVVGDGVWISVAEAIALLRVVEVRLRKFILETGAGQRFAGTQPIAPSGTTYTVTDE